MEDSRDYSLWWIHLAEQHYPWRGKQFRNSVYLVAFFCFPWVLKVIYCNTQRQEINTVNSVILHGALLLARCLCHVLYLFLGFKVFLSLIFIYLSLNHASLGSVLLAPPQLLLFSVFNDDLLVKSSPKCRSCSKDSRRKKGDRKLAYTRPPFDSNSRYQHSWLQVDHKRVLNYLLGNENTWKRRRTPEWLQHAPLDMCWHILFWSSPQKKVFHGIGEIYLSFSSLTFWTLLSQNATLRPIAEPSNSWMWNVCALLNL